MNFAMFYGKCSKCGKEGELFEQLIPIPEKPHTFRIGKMFCRECAKQEPDTVLSCFKEMKGE